MSLRIRSSTVRLGIFISTLAITVIIIFQLAWLQKVYKYEQKEFDHSVVKAIRGLYEDLEWSKYNSAHLNELIERPQSQLYIAHLPLPVNMDTLSAYLGYELEDFDIFTNCRFGVYSDTAKRYIYTGALTAAGGHERMKGEMPAPAVAYDHIALYFPNRQGYILSQMNFWTISSAILLIVLLLFGVSLYYFYRQKFLNETQKDFIHNFTHEFRTPVSVIQLAAEVLKEKKIIDKPERLSTYAGIVGSQAQYLNGQVERLLQFAYTDSGQLHLRREKVDLHGLVYEAVSNLAPLIEQKKAAIIYELNAPDPSLEGDRNYLFVVVLNLLDNALKYSRTPIIRISTSCTSQLLVLRITDNGIGIGHHQLKKLFKKFYRAQPGETYDAKGFGIGLAFVKIILDAHHASIKVESTPGMGSTFTVQLPLA